MPGLRELARVAAARGAGTVRDEMGGETIWRRFRRKATAGLGVQTQAPAKITDGAPDTKEAEALADALNHSAERVQTLWFSFLTFMIYLAIATGTTTHRMLFLEEPLSLPVLNIKLPLLGFYILTPIIFVTFHFYMLLNLVLLARTAKSFEDALTRTFPEDGERREVFRMRIENTLFVQLLVGAKREREGYNAKLLSLMTLITLALAPVLLLLMIQIKFLPYHSEWITWLHRFLLMVDVALVWTLWPGYRSGWGERLWPKRSWWLVPSGTLSALALAYAVLVATFPDERIYLATNRVHGELYRDFKSNERKWRNRPVWYGWLAFPNTLDLHGEGLIDYANLENISKKNQRSALEERWEPTLILKDRDLTEANLDNTDIRQVEFYHATLNRAFLTCAWAEKAHFDRAELHGTVLDYAQLQGGSFAGAQLQGASLDVAQLQAASFRGSQLQSASLVNAHLQGAWLQGAQLQAASLNGAQLQGAVLGWYISTAKDCVTNTSILCWTETSKRQDLDPAQFQEALLGPAQLQGAVLDDAQLQGAFLLGVQLQGASLKSAGLQSAWLDNAQLQAASLDNADLQGAWLSGVELQGAWLEHANLTDTWLESPFVWRTAGSPDAWKNVQIISSVPGRRFACSTNGTADTCDMGTNWFSTLKVSITDWLPEGKRRQAALEQIEQRLGARTNTEEEEKFNHSWTKQEHSSTRLSRDKFADQWRTSVAEQWRAAGCDANGAPYVVRELIARTYWIIFPEQSPEVWEVAAAFLDTDHCPGARGLSEAEIAILKTIRDRAKQPAPK